MKHHTSGNLAPFYQFFDTYGSERLNGLNESHFAGLNAAEKKEAWNYLQDGFEHSDERISGLFKLDPARAVALFKEALEKPMATSPYEASREAIESSRLFLLKFVYSVERDQQYLNAMAEFAGSEFENVRTLFATSAPTHQVTPEVLAALKGMILTETEQIPSSSAISKYMAIHGLNFNPRDPLTKSIYLSLRSDDQKSKMAGMKQLEERQAPDYA